MRVYFNKFFIPSLQSKQRREIINSKHEGDEDRHIAWRDLSEYNFRSSDLQREMTELKKSKMKVMDKLFSHRGQAEDELIHLMNEWESNQRPETKQNCGKNE